MHRYSAAPDTPHCCSPLDAIPGVRVASTRFATEQRVELRCYRCRCGWNNGGVRWCITNVSAPALRQTNVCLCDFAMLSAGKGVASHYEASAAGPVRLSVT